MSYIDHILVYGSESQTLRKLEGNYLKAENMWFDRRMMTIPRTYKQGNEDVLRYTNSQRQLVTSSGKDTPHSQDCLRETIIPIN